MGNGMLLIDSKLEGIAFKHVSPPCCTLRIAISLARVSRAMLSVTGLLLPRAPPTAPVCL